jgi:hypothetical protein
MTSIERSLALLVAQELGATRPELLSTDAIRRIYGRLAIQAAIEQVDPHEMLELLDRYGLTGEVLYQALHPASVLAVLEAAEGEMTGPPRVCAA